jgi:hypothetical protein
MGLQGNSGVPVAAEDWLSSLFILPYLFILLFVLF